MKRWILGLCLVAGATVIGSLGGWSAVSGQDKTPKTSKPAAPPTRRATDRDRKPAAAATPSKAEAEGPVATRSGGTVARISRAVVIAIEEAAPTLSKRLYQQ